MSTRSETADSHGLDAVMSEPAVAQVDGVTVTVFALDVANERINASG